MSRDYFSILGLAPGCYTAAEIRRRFRALKTHLDETGADDDASRAQRENIYLACNVLADPEEQADYLRDLSGVKDDVQELRRLIVASLEYDLLRHSRRQMILEAGRRIGLSDFQTQLLIAQVQFGDEASGLLAPAPARRRRRSVTPVPGLRLAAAAGLAIAIFVVLERWLEAVSVP